MSLSNYHQKYANQDENEIQRRIDAKEEELAAIFNEVKLNTKNDSIKLAVLGCGDKRFINGHKEIFEKVLNKKVDVFTFDITTDHLDGEKNVFKHDCTLEIPNSPYDITYAHVLLKFIETNKQFDIILNSYKALNIGGIAIHVFDNEEIESKEIKLSESLYSVPILKYKEELDKLNIKYKEIKLKYGPAIVLIK